MDPTIRIQTKILAVGNVHLPAEMRRRAGLKDGDPVTVSFVQEPQGGFLIAVTKPEEQA